MKQPLITDAGDAFRAPSSPWVTMLILPDHAGLLPGMLPFTANLRPNPTLSSAQAAQLLRAEWGIDGTLSDLGSTQDQNLLVTSPGGVRYVLKITETMWTRAELDLQNAAMRHIAAKELDAASPKPVRTSSGADIVDFEGHHIRLLTWVDGIPLGHRRQLERDDLAGLGALAARLALALADFDHPELERVNQWDPRRADEVVDRLLNQISDESSQPLIEEAMTPFRDLDGAALPTQPVHCDVTDLNTVCKPGRGGGSRPVGILDFGDVMRTWRIGDAAAAAAAAAGHASASAAAGPPAASSGVWAHAPHGPGTSYGTEPAGTSYAAESAALDAALAVLAGYHAACPLSEIELDAFWPLVLSRAAVCLTVSSLQAQISPDNEFIRDAVEVDLRALCALLAVPASLATAAARVAGGAPARPEAARVAEREWLARLRPAEIINAVAAARDFPIDLSVSSDSFAYGEWNDPKALRSIIATFSVPVGRWGECRLPDAGPAAPHEPANLHLGVDIFAAPGTEVRSPLPGTLVHLSDAGAVIDLRRPAGRDLFLRLEGISPANGLGAGSHVAAGALIGVVSPPAAQAPPAPPAAPAPAAPAPATAAPAPPAAPAPAAPASAVPAPATLAPATLAPVVAALPPHVHVQLLAAADLPSLGTLHDALLRAHRRVAAARAQQCVPGELGQ